MPRPRTRAAGWTPVAFGDVVRLSTERSSDPQKAGFARYVGLDHIDPGELRIRRWGDVAYGTTFTTIFRPGQVLFGKRRAYQRKVAVADFSGVCSGDIYVFEPKGEHLLPELLPFICQTDAFFDHAVGTSAGSLSPRTNWTSLATFKFALPPIQEQSRIVAVLRAYAGTVETMRHVLNEVYLLKASLLAASYPTSLKEGDSTFADLLQNGAVAFLTGPFGTVLSANEYEKEGWPIVNPTDIRHGRIEHQGGAFLHERAATRLAKYRMREGDVLLARKGEIDKACLVEKKHNGWIVGSDCIRLRCDTDLVSPAYLLYFLQSPGTARRLASLAHGTIMQGLNETMLAQVPITMPSKSAQIEVVRRLSQLDDKIAHIQNRLHQSLRLFQTALSEIIEGDRCVV